MIVELDKNNLQIIDDSFLDKKYLENELSVNPYARVIILIENKEVIGYLYFSDIYDRAEINQIEINSIHRNCGKSKILMEYFLNTIKKDITLEVRIDNVPAINLYKKYNFQQVALRKGYYNGIDGILMERKKE